MIGRQLYKLAGAAWVTFVIVYLPLVLLTDSFTIVPDTPLEIGVLAVGTLLGGVGPYGPDEPRPARSTPTEDAVRAEHERIDRHFWALNEQVSRGDASEETIAAWTKAKDEWRASVERLKSYE